MKSRATGLDTACVGSGLRILEIERRKSSPTSFYTLRSILEGSRLLKALLGSFWGRCDGY